jgi:hypothetical protein
MKSLARRYSNIGNILYWSGVLLLLATVSADRLAWLVYDRSWISGNHEGFAWTFITTINMEMPDSYWYQYYGLTGMPLLTRLLHFATRSIRGSTQFTMEYVDLFSKLTFTLLYVLIIGSCLVIFIKIRSRTMRWPILLVFLILNYMWMFSTQYHQPVSILGFYELYIYFYTAIFCFVLIDFDTGRLERSAPALATICGALAGMLFFDMPIYGWLSVFCAAPLLMLTRGKLRWRCAGLVAASGLITAPLALWAAFGFHASQASAALVQHIHIILHGLGGWQPGFQENFVTLFLSPRSDYFQQQVLMLIAAVVWLIALVNDSALLMSGATISRGRIGPALPIAIDLIFVLAGLASGYSLFRQASSTTIDSLALMCLFYIGCRMSIAAMMEVPIAGFRLSLLPVAWIVLGVGVPAIFLPVLTGIAVPHDVPSLINLLDLNWRGKYFEIDQAEGRLVRSLDAFLNHFANHYTVIESPDSYWMFDLLIYPLRPAADFNFRGLEGVPGGPRFLPSEDEVERKFHRRYHFVNNLSVPEITRDCRAGTTLPEQYADRMGMVSMCATIKMPFGTKIVNMGPSRLKLGDEAYIYPFPQDRGMKIYEMLANGFTWQRIADAPDGQPGLLLSAEKRRGIKEEICSTPWMSCGWSILPVDMRQLENFLSPLAAPLIQSGYGSYLLRMDSALRATFAVIFVRPDLILSQ